MRVFSRLPTNFRSTLVLQELRVNVTAATELVTEIGDRFKVGDAAPEQTARLIALVAAIDLLVARAGALPADLRADIAKLLAQVKATTIVGGRWLEAIAAGPELANLQMRVRVQKLYGVPFDPIPPPLEET